jgi:hypothetical protein
MIGLAELADRILNRAPATQPVGSARPATPSPAPRVSPAAPPTTLSVSTALKDRGTEFQSDVTTDISARWADLVAKIAEQKPSWATLLRECIPSVFDQSQLELAVDKTSSIAQILEDRLPQIGDLVATLLQKPVAVRLIDRSMLKKKA